MRTIRLGAGAGYSGDRIDPAVALAEHGRLDYLVFECLAERTIALAHQALRHNPQGGFDPLLEARMRAVLPACARGGVRIITNMGAANPVGAARRVAAIAAELGLTGLSVAAVTGDDVLDAVLSGDFTFEESGVPVSSRRDAIISANAYLGVEGISQALAKGAQVVVTGRVSDPALFAAPLVHEFGWSLNDAQRLGQATLAGHLLECAGQITGGYFADPGFKNVPNLALLGFPIGEVSENGDIVVTKLEGSGGCVTEATCKEQLLYEIHDPARYLQPDVVADFTDVTVSQIGMDRVHFTGGRGSVATGLLKVSVGYLDGYVGEGQISYAGPGAVERGRLALDVVRRRLEIIGVGASELRFDLIGVDALHRWEEHKEHADPYEVRVRVAGRTLSLAQAVRIGNEVETLYTNGPSGGGGATKTTREIIAIQSVLMPRGLVHPQVHFVEHCHDQAS